MTKDFQVEGPDYAILADVSWPDEAYEPEVVLTEVVYQCFDYDLDITVAAIENTRLCKHLESMVGEKYMSEVGLA